MRSPPPRLPDWSMTLRNLSLAVVTLAAVGLSIVALDAASIVTANAADPFYMGTWRLTFATMAPWGHPSRLQDSADKARLIGKAIDFRPKEIAGPEPLACKEPQYQGSNSTAET